MSQTLFDLTLRTAIQLQAVRQGTATGGATNTIIDTNLLATLDDDYYKQGTYWVTDTTDDGAPENEMGIISAFVGSTGTATLQDTLSAAIAAGDKWAMCAPRFKLYELIQQINEALYIDGYIPVTDTSLTTVADQREYTLPQAATLDLRDVKIYTNNDSDRNIPIPSLNYEIRYTATGSADTLVLDQDYTAGLTIELTYGAQHADLEVSTDKLNDSIHPDRIVYAAAANAMRAYRDRTRLKHLDGTIDMLDRKAQVAQDRFPLPVLPTPRTKVLTLGRNWISGSGFFEGSNF